MSRLWVLFDRAEAEGANCVPLADQIRKLESDIGAFDASLSASKVHVTSEDLSFEERVKIALAVKPQGEPRVIPLLEDGEFATYRELPPPVRGDS